MHSQLAVLMFADIVGYSAMMEVDQQQTIDLVRSLRVDLLEPEVQTHAGRILKRLGDGWIVSFGSVPACVDCAMSLQKKLQAETELKLRIGAHIGEIVSDGEDFYGSGLNIAQRIEAEAPPGGLMISEDLFRQLSGQLAGELKDAGTFRLKNIAQPVRLYQWRPMHRRKADPDQITSIAVAAIEYAPLDAETAALAGDLHDQLVIRMSRRQGVVVLDAANRSVEHATYDLRSRLRVAGGRGRLSLSLVLRSDGRPVWSESYDRDTADIFDFCDVVLERAEADLRIQTNAFDGDRLAHIPEEELSVSELRARAANAFYRLTYEDWIDGLRLMKRAIRMNPRDGVSLAMRAEAEIMTHAARYAALAPDLLAGLADDLDTAIEQNPGSDYVFWTRGLFRINCMSDIAGARADLQRSRDLNPAYAENHELEAHVLMVEGKFDRAAEKYGLLLQRQVHNPMIPYRRFLRASAHFCGGRYDLAAEDARLAADTRPKERAMHVLRGLALQAGGEKNAARDVFRRAASLAPRPDICSRCPVLPESHLHLAEALASAIRSPQGKLDGIET
ncbi:adenylate/guanylate cyclase domain-containing protein [Ruegeria marina]|uniref:Adenylate cyclase, class 3 n=1 Tax=Ruegeria marina TaxID=639004 RepID=A0A1G6LUW7_9RHOB|nr:adenylate/guanylate cyclase domain-containing protein [Ruegeria marina]SDC46496.1 Adenylate cyclase, class 3 [Ruegeria marina]